jgi:hypothetical protein
VLPFFPLIHSFLYLVLLFPVSVSKISSSNHNCFTKPLFFSTLSCHPQTACNHFAKLHKYFKCSCW